MGARTQVAETPGKINWCELSWMSPFWQQDPSPPKNLRLQCLNSSGQTRSKTGTQQHPSTDRLPKVLLSSQLPQNAPLDMDLPPRGTRLSSTQHRAGTVPSHKEACISPWTKLTHQGTDIRSKRNYDPAACGKETANTVSLTK